LSDQAGTDLETAFRQTGVMLLNGWGFNWYRVENLLRADDILLRNQADVLLGDALSAFRRAEAMFRQRHLATAARGASGADPGHMAELRGFQAMITEIEACRTQLRGAAVPPPDRITRRATSEAGLLDRLGNCDARLAAFAQALRADAMAITPAGLAALPALAETHLRQLRDVLRERADLLDLMQS
jgi:hypothetical protein